MLKIENLLPIFAPMPPAVVIGAQLYAEVINATSAAWWPIAGLAATLGTVGTIGAEMYSYKMALRALAEREKGAFIAAIIGAFITSGLIIWAVWRSDSSRPLVVAVAVAIVAYMISGLQDYLTAKNKRRQSTADNTLAQLAAQAELEKQRAKIASAQARQAKAEHSNSFVRANTNTRTVEQNSRALGADKIAEIREYQKANPDKTVREAAAACGVSVGSVAKYGKAVQQ